MLWERLISATTSAIDDAIAVSALAISRSFTLLTSQQPCCVPPRFAPAQSHTILSPGDDDPAAQDARHRTHHSTRPTSSRLAISVLRAYCTAQGGCTYRPRPRSIRQRHQFAP